MQIKEIRVYDYEELSENAKARARDWYREGGLDYDWYDSLFDWAKQAGACLGVQVDDIRFSGFWSQGDGASFTGTYRYRPGWRVALRAEFGGEALAELERIGSVLQAAQMPVFYKGSAVVSQRGRYCHEYSADIECDPSTTSFEADTQEALRDFMRWVYTQLGREYEYLVADGTVEEAILANGYEFTSDGKIFIDR